MGLSLQQLCDAVSGLAPDLAVTITKNSANADLVLTKFSPIQDALEGELSFLSHPKYAHQLIGCKASAIVLNDADWQVHHSSIACEVVIVCSNPYAFFAFASQVLYKHNGIANSPQTHLNACVHPTATIGKNVNIGAYCVIQADVLIGDDCVIGSHVTIGQGTQIGECTQLYSQVTVYHATTIGRGCIIHSGTVIGSDGFGFAPYKKRWIKIPQTGTVIIGDDVEIGSNCTIDRGAMGDTVIGRGTKLDNLIQIAHNVHIGEDCAFAANIAIAGSAILGNRIQIGGNAGVLGHLSVCDDVVISSCTLVTKTIAKPGFYSGVYPIQENADWEKNAVALKRLNALRLQVREIEQNIKTTKMAMTEK